MHNNLKIHFYIAVVGILTIFSHNSYGQDTLSVLFLGNSYTSYNNLPQMVAELSKSANKTLIVDANMPGGFTISNHLNDLTSINKIKQRKWDYVIIQEQSQLPTIDFYRYNDMYPSLTKLKDTIEKYNACAKIITYMTWGRRFGGMQCDPSNTHCSPNFVNFNHMQDSLTSAYLDISNQLGIQCAPVGVVWQNIFNETSYVLHDGDNSHPNIEGSYVAACAIYTSIWKQGSSGLTYYAGLSSTLAQYYQSISDDTYFTSIYDWNLTINKPRALFSISILDKTVTLENRSTPINNKLTYLWDFGDGDTSTEINPIHEYATNGSYTVKLIAINCTFSDTLQIEITVGSTGIQEDTKHAIEFYPNPITDYLSLNTDSRLIGSEYCIYDPIGKCVWKGTIDAENMTIDLGHLSKGLYVFKIGNEHNQTFKVVKQ
jgi:PKD repeat protein